MYALLICDAIIFYFHFGNLCLLASKNLYLKYIFYI
jgi:hypothetical protein